MATRKSSKPAPVDASNDSQELAMTPGAPTRSLEAIREDTPVPAAPWPVRPETIGEDIAAPQTDAQLEQKIEELKPTGPRLTPEHIQRVIVDEIYTRIEGTLTTVCTLVLRNGFTVVGVNNGPVSPENFNQELACEYAYKKAVDQIWSLEGYLLKEFLAEGKAKSELNPIAEIAKAWYAVNAAYHGNSGGLNSPKWDAAGDEVQMRAIEMVAAVMRGEEDVRPESDPIERAMLMALVDVLSGGRHG